MRIHALGLVLLAGLAVAACDRADAPPAAADPPSEAPTDGDDAGVTMRYDCGDGHVVAIMGDSARVTTGDGRQLDLPRIADTSPPLYAGEAMEFAIGSEDAQLAQDEGATWTCTPQ